MNNIYNVDIRILKLSKVIEIHNISDTNSWQTLRAIFNIF